MRTHIHETRAYLYFTGDSFFPLTLIKKTSCCLFVCFFFVVFVLVDEDILIIFFIALQMDS